MMCGFWLGWILEQYKAAGGSPDWSVWKMCWDDLTSEFFKCFWKAKTKNQKAKGGLSYKVQMGHTLEMKFEKRGDPE